MNWLFVSAAETGQRTAILHTIVKSFRRRGIDPYAYLRDVLTPLAEDEHVGCPQSYRRSLARAQRAMQRRRAA